MYEQPFNPFAANLAVVKGYFKNSKVLVMGILYIVSAVLSVISAIVSANSASAFVNDYLGLLNNLGIDASEYTQDFSELTTMISSSVSASTVTGVIFSVALTGLIAAGFLIIYLKSRNDAPDSTPITGVNILYVISVIYMVISIIAAVAIGLCVIAVIFIFMGLSSYITSESIDIRNGYELNVSNSVLVVLLVILVIIAVLAIVYMLLATVNRKRYYGSVKESISSTELQSKGAKPYGVICIIDAVFTGFTLISSLFSLTAVSAFGGSSVIGAKIVSLLSVVLSFAVCIVDAMLALGYKKYIDEVKYGYNGSPNGGAPGFGYNPSAPVGGAQTPYNTAPPQPTQYNDGFSNAPQQPVQAAPAVCPNCGAPADGSPFCGNCGAKL